MKIRRMTEGDIQAVLRLDEKAFDKAWTEQSFLDEIKKDYSHYFICENDTEIIGYAGIWCIYETAELIRIAVLPECQGRGIGGMLMEKILESANECSCERMMLEVRKSNISARKLYERNGFAQISVRKGYYNGEDAVIMEKRFL